MQRLLLRAQRLRRATDSLQHATNGCASSSSSSSASAWRHQQHGASCRAYSSAEGGGEQQQDVSTIGNDKVRKLAEEVMGLTVLECSWLSEILRKKLNIQKPAFGAMPMMPMGMGGAPAAAAGGEEAAPAEAKKEKTEFTVKLDGFSPDGKIKVIKEIRAITSLGLKEAKDLVEKAPVVVKAGLSKADAEAMQKQLEGVGGKVVLE